MPIMVFYIYFRYPDFIAPCVGVHPVQSQSPDRSATLEVCETVTLKIELFACPYS